MKLSAVSATAAKVFPEDEMQGLIFNIQRFSIHDGPGIRTTVFLKGCNLKCTWCHNPESQSPKKEILFYAEKCARCGRCESIPVEDADFICFNGARELCGKEMTAEEVLSVVTKDRAFYENSGGGVTFSGGECMLQLDFLAEMLKLCKEKGLHTAVDTAGHVPWESFQRILPYTDLFLYDIKSMDSAIHKKYTGVENGLILENLTRLLRAKATVCVRVPVIPSVNDTVEEMKRINAFFEENGYPADLELLPYHNMGENKYEALGKPVQSFTVPGKEKIEMLKQIVIPH